MLEASFKLEKENLVMGDNHLFLYSNEGTKGYENLVRVRRATKLYQMLCF